MSQDANATPDTPPPGEIDIHAWCIQVIEGPGGMRVYEDREVVEWNIPIRHAVAEWVIRCLANPSCDGSAEVIAAIQRRRAKLEGKTL